MSDALEASNTPVVDCSRGVALRHTDEDDPDHDHEAEEEHHDHGHDHGEYRPAYLAGSSGGRPDGR